MNNNSIMQHYCGLMETECTYCVNYENLGSFSGSFTINKSSFCLKAIKYVDLIDECPIYTVQELKEKANDSKEDQRFANRLDYGFELMNMNKKDK